MLAYFRRQNGRAFFPPLPIAARFPRRWRGAYLPLARWDASMWLGNFAARINRLIFFSPQSAVGTLTPCGLGCFVVVWRFLQRKGQREVKITLALIASHEARRRMAAFTVQAAGNRTRPASREACRRAAVVSQSSCMSPEHPARQRRAVRGQGVLPLEQEGEWALMTPTA